MLLVRLLGLAPGEHLDLVELVDADDAAGVLAVAAGLAAEARGPAAVALGTGGEVEDLALVVAGQRDLGGADQVEVVVLEPVDLVGVLAEEPGALHDLGPHEHGRDHHGEAVGGGLLRGELQHAQLEQGAVAGEEVEAGAGDLRAPLHVEQPEALAQLEVVLGLEVEGGDLADPLDLHEVVLAAGGRALLDDVRQQTLEPVDLGRRGLLGLLGVLDRLLEGARGLEQRRALLGRGLTDLLAVGLLLGAGGVRGRDGGAAGLVGGQQLVDQRRILATGALGVADEVGVLAEQLEIDHASQPSGPRESSQRPVAAGRRGPLRRRTVPGRRPSRTCARCRRPWACRRTGRPRLRRARGRPRRTP